MNRIASKLVAAFVILLTIAFARPLSAQAPPATKPQQKGAPVDPRYGNAGAEVGQMADFGYDTSRNVRALVQAVVLGPEQLMTASNNFFQKLEGGVAVSQDELKEEKARLFMLVASAAQGKEKRLEPVTNAKIFARLGTIISISEDGDENADVWFEKAAAVLNQYKEKEVTAYREDMSDVLRERAANQSRLADKKNESAREGQSRELLLKALEMAQACSYRNAHGEAVIRLRLGALLIRLRRWQEASGHLSPAINILERLVKASNRRIYKENLREALLDAGKASTGLGLDAEFIYQRVAKEFWATISPRELARTYEGLAQNIVVRAPKDLPPALPNTPAVQKSALEKRAKEVHGARVAVLVRAKEAFLQAKEAIDKSQRVEDTMFRIEIYSSLAFAWAQIGEDQKALDIYEAALKIGREAPGFAADRANMLPTMVGHASVLVKMGQREEALAQFEEGMKVVAASPSLAKDPTMSQLILLQYARYLAQLGRWEESDRRYKDLLAAIIKSPHAEYGPDSPALIGVFAEDSQVLGKLGKAAEAAAASTEAVRLYQKFQATQAAAKAASKKAATAKNAAPSKK